ncbi:MAG: hypothetical protein KJ645_14555 [Planctomycetes bacterium]|nr:hypothetical protein [Planctomycetota bacterium]
MDLEYSCPECNAVLNPGDKIILMGRHQGRNILLAFHPEPGIYDVQTPHTDYLKTGDIWEFYCPLCHTSLAVPGEDDLAVLDMTDRIGNWHKVLFSRVAGEQITYVLTKGKELSVEEYGSDLSKYDHLLWHNFI